MKSHRAPGRLVLAAAVSAALLAAAPAVLRRPAGPLGTPFGEIHLSRRHDIPGRLVALIDGAEEEVLVSSFGFNLHSVLSALERARSRGVRVILAADARAAGHLRRFDPGEIRLAGGSGLMHKKFGVVDRKTAWLGSFNLTCGAAYRHDEDLVVFHSPLVAGYLCGVFSALTGERPPPEPLFKEKQGFSLAVYVTPHCRPALEEALAAAREEIFFSQYVFTDPVIRDILAGKARAGLEVNGILERGMRFNRETFSVLEAAGARPAWDRNHDLNHHKLFVIDRRTVVTGSYNPSRAAVRNREIIAVIDHPETAAYYLRHLAR